jgi:DNA-binding GntR family transcriptional regulator
LFEESDSLEYYKLNKSSLKHRIAHQIRKLILEGKLQPGDKVTEMHLSSELGVSRGPIREAIQQLEMEGYLVSTPYKETKVAEISKEEVVELLIPMRMNIETFALKKGYPFWTDKTYDILYSILKEMKKGVLLKDLFTVVESDLQLHQVIIESSRMDGLSIVWGSIINRIRLHYTYQHLQQQKKDEYLAAFIEPNETLLKVFQTGDLQIAIQALKDHIVLMEY